MPRTLTAALLAAMNSGSYTAVIRAWGVFELTRTYQLQVLSFKLQRDELDLEVIGYDDNTMTQICLERGVSIAGVEYTIFSSLYYVKTWSYHLGIHKLECKAVYPGQSVFSVAADKTYSQVISAASLVYNTVVYIGDPPWKAYKCLPAGRTILLQGVRSVLPWLRQKYLIFVTDYEYRKLFWFSIEEAYAQASSWTFTTTELDTLSEHREYRRFIWRDENGTVHYSATNTYAIHNLGYLEAACASPAAPDAEGGANAMIGTKIHVPANLKYLTGDTATINGIKVILDVIEVFDRKASPAWYMDLCSFQFLSDTEGGSLPGTIQAAAPYTPLNTSYFTNVLSYEDNNIQAAMESLDDHTHLAILTAEPTVEIVGSCFALDTTTGTFYVWNGTTWTPISGGATTTFYLQLETGDYVLTENGDRLILE